MQVKEVNLFSIRQKAGFPKPLRVNCRIQIYHLVNQIILKTKTRFKSSAGRFWQSDGKSVFHILTQRLKYCTVSGFAV